MTRAIFETNDDWCPCCGRDYDADEARCGYCGTPREPVRDGGEHGGGKGRRG